MKTLNFFSLIMENRFDDSIEAIRLANVHGYVALFFDG